MVELRQLRYFLAVAEELSVTAAARRFHMAQPALSQAITKLERQLGAALFDRAGGRLRLTAAGRLLMPEARALLERAREITDLVPHAQSPERTVLRIGSIASAVSGLLPRVLPAFLARHPWVLPRVYEMGQRRQVEAVRAGDIDIGVCRLPRVTDDGAAVRVLPLGDERLCCAVPEGHPPAAGPVPLRTLADRDLIGFPRSLAPVAYDTIVAVCMRAGFSPRFSQEAHNDQAILGLVACGLGLALVPDMTTRVAVRGVSYLPLAEPYAVTPLSVIVHAASPPEPALLLRDALHAVRPSR
ncbi:LysR family transcriptional regulator [Streptomyces johnsoniae]|uniref:LysR family transcriptional regulator n=1 Tax=Streptomyces johnsoniae TaxID=3075532 RepID=A0ABU2RXG9_9ACTN|nr:LysR family transcriptional regulator [Streptomyces sp. DSM 41886]MDT0441446.1 LysR family transcriptional regulator [Streptomyces sp. DSM 41886]